MSSHVFEQHPSDVQIRLEAPTPAGLFEQAAAALAELIGAPVPRAVLGPWRTIMLEARDLEALLVAWLNELVARTELDQRLYVEVALDELGPTRLRARVRGAPIRELRTAVKAATMHGLRVEAGPRGAVATVILDV